MLVLKLFTFVVIWVNFVTNAASQIAYKRHLSELRIQELHNLAIRLEHSVNPSKFPCDNYYDYVCSKNRPLFSVFGHLPDYNELIQLFSEIQDNPEHFEASQKLIDFFVSCNHLKNLEDCYREAFEYFKPLFGYMILKNHIDASTHEHQHFLRLLDGFLKKADQTENFQRHPIRLRLATLRDKFRTPHMFFRVSNLNREYSSLRIYRESYVHNVRNLEQYLKYNSTFTSGIPRTILDWTLYVYQSRNKPMSYFFSTLNVHLWMSLYNTTERLHDSKYFNDVGECLKLPQFVNVLEEARIMAIIYLKSFQNAWNEYHDWIITSSINQDIYDHENEILKQYHLNNRKIFFTLYSQNFCDFGKELAENVFFVGLKRNHDFYTIYSCGFQTEKFIECI